MSERKSADATERRKRPFDLTILDADFVRIEHGDGASAWVLDGLLGALHVRYKVQGAPERRWGVVKRYEPLAVSVHTTQQEAATQLAAAKRLYDEREPDTEDDGHYGFPLPAPDWDAIVEAPVTWSGGLHGAHTVLLGCKADLGIKVQVVNAIDFPGFEWRTNLSDLEPGGQDHGTVRLRKGATSKDWDDALAATQSQAASYLERVAREFRDRSKGVPAPLPPSPGGGIQVMADHETEFGETMLQTLQRQGIGLTCLIPRPDSPGTMALSLYSYERPSNGARVWLIEHESFAAPDASIFRSWVVDRCPTQIDMQRIAEGHLRRGDVLDRRDRGGAA